MKFNTPKIVLLTAMLFILNVMNVYAESYFSINDKLKALESTTEGRLGIYAINTENGQIISYRANEIFPTGCTSKVIGVAAVLKKSMSNPELLKTTINYSKKDLVEWSPVTKEHVNEGMMISALCAASISYSDNTAMNLLLKPIGGVQGMTDFARSINDFTFRQDSDWPAEAYSGGPNNSKDSSAPKAMVESLQKLTLGEALTSPHRDLLTTWLIGTNTGAARIRSSIPKTWIVGNKTGTGALYGTTNDLAIIWPIHHKPLLLGVYYTTDEPKATKREDVVSAATKLVVQEWLNQDNTLKID